MNDMTPFTVRLTADRAKTMLEEAGAQNVHVVGRGYRMLAFFETGRKRQAWILRGNGRVDVFAYDLARELLAQ
jgi:ribosomal protein S11